MPITKNGIMLPYFAKKLHFLSDYGIKFGDVTSNIYGSNITIPMVLLFVLSLLFYVYASLRLGNSNEMMSKFRQAMRELEDKLGIDRTRIGQFLRLMRLPETTWMRLRNERELNEFRLRRLVGERAAASVGSD